ncbi:MAG: fibronectin type III domain-containing protein, partial [Planctomycetaceae bacterium]|nr:fibronectin type III domain-containing protein [Planctomycetaceae bacterium]
MTFFQRIFGNNGNNNRKEQKSNTPQKRQLRIEPLECREMLSMNPLSLEVRPEPSDVPLRADALLTADSQGPAKNIILMIGDGMGFNTAQLGLLGNSNVAALLNDMFPVSLGVTTYGLTENALYYLDEDYGYDPTRYWNGSNVNNRYQPVSGQGVRTADSEQAITAMVTGEKISPQGVSWNNLYGTGGRLENIADIANEDGKMTGAVTTVPASHATPAGVGAHNPNRNLYQVLFDEMIENLDLVFGGGDPTGPATSNNNTYIVGASTWNSLTSGTPINGTSYELLRSKEDFQAYADGTKDWADSTKDKVAGVFNARDSRYNTLLQQGTAAYDALPDLTTMSLAALNILNTSDDGFFVMLEGGGIDWAAHAGVSTNAAKSNLLAEVNDYFKAVLAVYEWITVNDMWENTLLIVTADHETGDVWGAGGAYNVPTSTATTGFAGLYTDHTNALVPLWAAGAGSDLFEQYIYGIDTTAANKWHAVAGFNGWDGSYIDNTSIFDVMYTAMTRDEQPSTVVTTLDDTVNPRDGKISLREAIEYAQPGDTITFATSQHGKTIKLGGNELYIDKNITINATGTNITISADGKSRVFNIDEHATVTLMGVTITGGYTTSGGGGIYNGGTLTVMNSVIFDNSAFAGGGIYNSGTLKITNSTISDNSATNGGGICSNGVLELRNTIVVENSGSDIDRQSGTVSGFNNLTAFDAWDVSINNILYNSGILLFVNAASGNYRLASGSQAIDKGNNSYVIGDTDLAGTPRIVNDIVDIGAYEYSVLVAPVNFLSTDRTAGSVTLTWNAQGNLTGYTLEYKKSTDLTWTVWTPAPTVSATSATITGLTANTAYDFRLTATNASGSASSTTEATTLVTPPVIPGNFRSTDRTSNSVTLAWNTQSNLTGYTLEYKKSTDLTWTVWTSAPNASATSATITDLAANTKYDFRLTAKNAGGSASSITDATTLPPAPANFISTSQTTTSITLAWNAVPGATGYVLQYKRGTSSSWKEVTVASGVLTATVTGLRVNTAYNFRIQAINAGGPSDWATVNVATKANAPTAPVNFRSTSQTSNSVTLSWNSQSNLTSYTLEYKLATASTWTTWTPAPGTSATTATITDLVSNSTYNFRLTAINTGGSASSTVNATTLVAALATPTNFGSTAQTLNSVTLAWGTVTNATGYVLQYKKATDTAWTTAPAPTGTSATIIGLAVNTAYNFRVRATNAIGSS